jgi:hypothetical protein
MYKTIAHLFYEREKIEYLLSKQENTINNHKTALKKFFCIYRRLAIEV